MFSWWSSLEPPKSEGGGGTSEKPVEGEPKTNVESSDSKPDVSTNESERKGSELDYAKDVAKNVGSKYF